MSLISFFINIPFYLNEICNYHKLNLLKLPLLKLYSGVSSFKGIIFLKRLAIS